MRVVSYLYYNPLYKDLQIHCTSIGVELQDMGRNENDDISLQTNTVPSNIQGTHESLASYM